MDNENSNSNRSIGAECTANSASQFEPSRQKVGDSVMVRRLTFGGALEWIKRGHSVTRFGWNGRGQKVWLVEGSDPSNPSERAQHLSGGIPASLFARGDAGTTRRMPHLAIRTVDGATATWVPSITDVLAEDWVIG